MLSCSPAHAASRNDFVPAAEPLVQATDASSKREDLRTRQIEPTLGHRVSR